MEQGADECLAGYDEVGCVPDRTTYAILTLLLVCLTAMIGIECQVHTAVSAHMAPTSHHHSQDGAGDTTGASPCLLAVLPIGVFLVIFASVWLPILLRMVHGASPTLIAVLALTPALATAQMGSGRGMGMHGRMGADDGAMMQMQGMMQQMGGMLEHMAARLQAGPVVPEQARQMSEVMEHMAEMMSHRSWMTSADTPQQMTNMLERMTEMHKRLMSVMAAPVSQPAPQGKK